MIVELDCSKLIVLRNEGDIYFQKIPLISGFKTKNKIPGSAVTSYAIYAGNAKLFKLYEITPFFSLNTCVPLIWTIKFCSGRLDISGFGTYSNIPS